jgi:nitroreductase
VIKAIKMEFFDVVKSRHSIRAFKSKAVEEEKIQKILETANKAPSAGNFQGYEIILVRDEKRKQELARAAHGQSFVAEAPVVLVVCTNEKRSAHYGKRGHELYCINDASIAAAYIQLAATALGLSTVWVGAFRDDEVSRIVKAPDYVKPVAIIPIGYASEEPEITERRNIKDLVHKETF